MNRLTWAMRRASTTRLDAKEFIAVARSFGALKPPPDLWSRLVETNVVEQGQPLNAIVTCFHAMALHAFSDGRIRDSAALQAAMPPLVERIRANMSFHGVREVGWTAFGFMQFPKHVDPADHVLLCERIVKLEASGALQKSTKEQALSLVYAAANLSLQARDLYPALARVCARVTFTVDEVARICVRFGMSRVSESSAPLVSLVVSKIHTADAMRGQHVGEERG